MNVVIAAVSLLSLTPFKNNNEASSSASPWKRLFLSLCACIAICRRAGRVLECVLEALIVMPHRRAMTPPVLNGGAVTLDEVALLFFRSKTV